MVHFCGKYGSYFNQNQEINEQKNYGIDCDESRELMKPMKVSSATAQNYYFKMDPVFSADGMLGGNAAWVGRGASTLGLSGGVELDAFNNLLFGRSPDGQTRLVGRENGPQAHHLHGATDIPLTAPKSFSVVSLYDPTLREAIQDAAIKTGEYIEANHIYGRQTLHGETTQVQSKMVAALFMHSTSRTNDAHFHGHLVILNVVIRPDGSFSALENRSLFQHQAAITQTFYSHLSDETRTLGYGIEQHLGSAGQKIPELAGYRQEINDLFSQRHEDIKGADQLRANLAERLPHLKDQAIESILQLQTKSEKETNLNETDLVKRHTEKLEAIGISPAEYLSELKQSGQELQLQERLAMTEQFQAAPHQSIVMGQEILVHKEAALSAQDPIGGEAQHQAKSSATLDAIYAERLEELKSEADSLNNGHGQELTQGISQENNQAVELQHQQDIELAI
jgi:conjugative relaxase-like TrwC/TraI family protein